jgi:putative transposase
MMLAHRIRLDPTPAQRDYFARAAGTARRVWNWALAEWQRLASEGKPVTAFQLKKRFNAIKYVDPAWLDENGKPWLREIHRDAHAQPFTNLGKALARYFEQRRAKVSAYPPRFKKKGRSRDAFYLANDKFRLEGSAAVLPKIGLVAMREQMRFTGKIMGASVSRDADHWYLAIQVDMPDAVAHRRRSADAVIGIDLGLTAAATFSNGEKIAAPKPLRTALRRLRIRSRRHSRKVLAQRAQAVPAESATSQERKESSSNTLKAARVLAHQHAHIGNIRKDWSHKLTTRLCRENQAIAIEDLNIAGMLRNRKLSRSISDIGWYRIRTQIEYKALRYGTLVVVADRWYPSTKLCAACGVKHDGLTLAVRSWKCAGCGAHHDRDINAANNLKRLATDALAACTALPVANLAATPDTAAGMLPAGGGKVTPVRHEHGQQDGSGQEEDAEYMCTRL